MLESLHLSNVDHELVSNRAMQGSSAVGVLSSLGTGSYATWKLGNMSRSQHSSWPQHPSVIQESKDSALDFQRKRASKASPQTAGDSCFVH